MLANLLLEHFGVFRGGWEPPRVSLDVPGGTSSGTPCPRVPGDVGRCTARGTPGGGVLLEVAGSPATRVLLESRGTRVLLDSPGIPGWSSTGGMIEWMGPFIPQGRWWGGSVLGLPRAVGGVVRGAVIGEGSSIGGLCMHALHAPGTQPARPEQHWHGLFGGGASSCHRGVLRECRRPTRPSAFYLGHPIP